MFKFLKNPFSEGDAVGQRKTAQKELETQKLAKPAEHTEAKKNSPKPGAAAVRPAKKSAAKTNLEAGYGIILKPHVSEKTAAAGTHDTYAFVVSRNANKIEIKKAFFKMYGVEPIGIQVANVSARAVNFRRVSGFKSSWKKAYIRVPKGSSVAVYEGV